MISQATKDTAIEAVKSASAVCKDVQFRLITSETVAKNDKSPVTIADFAVQAAIFHALHKIDPTIPFVGEEDATTLREDKELLAGVTRAAMAANADLSEDTICSAIDLGQHSGGTSGRFWCLDPIDGTKGFIRGDQYAIALALIEDGEVIFGVLGCPNLDGGLYATATKGEGAFAMQGDDQANQLSPIKVMETTDATAARFCESVESGHSAQDVSAQIASELGITREPYRIDSQCKYAAVARAEAEIYLRLPTRADYVERIWDHAAGKIIVEEAGGKVTDIHGKPLDFSLGRGLEDNQGVVATNGRLHDEVIAAIGVALR